METNQNVGERIKRLREERNYSQQYLAGKLGISQKAYSKIETNQTRLSVDSLLKIAEILETSINKILDTDGNAVYNNFSTHTGEGIVIHKTTSDKVFELYDKIIQSKDEEIKRLKDQNDLLIKTIGTKK